MIPIPNYPYLSPSPQTRLSTQRFGGYERRLMPSEGAFYETKNLSTRHFPLLSTRPKRGIIKTLSAPGGLIGKDALAWVEGGTLYVNGAASPLTGLSEGEKQLVGMGAYILIFPDKLYYNTENSADFGSMEAELELSGSLSYSLCTAEGEELPDPQPSAAEPSEPENAQLWLDISESPPVLRQYSQALSLWTQMETVFTKLRFSTQGQIPKKFSKYDGITVSGAYFDCLNGEKIIYALGGAEGEEQDYIVLAGLIEAAFTEENAAISLSRRLPDMDFVCQCRNRLWGCRYGRSGGETVNEIYCSALGDFKNFHQFLGLSTDSWAASIGSDGAFTGAINYLGSPCFFKEDRIHRVTVSAIGAHAVEEIACRGVQRGSHRSLCVVGESLYYKSPAQVCVWQGGFPQSVGADLGEERYFEAVAGACGLRYYISMRDSAGAWQLFTLDTALGIWLHEDELHALCFAERRGELYCIDAESGRLLAMSGAEGESEGELDFLAETGLMHFETPERKYISRLSLGLAMAAGALVRVYLRYDGVGDWEPAGEISLAAPGSVTLPVRPRRCGYLQLRLAGQGDVKLCYLSRIFEQGSNEAAVL